MTSAIGSTQSNAPRARQNTTANETNPPPSARAPSTPSILLELGRANSAIRMPAVVCACARARVAYDLGGGGGGKVFSLPAEEVAPCRFPWPELAGVVGVKRGAPRQAKPDHADLLRCSQAIWVHVSCRISFGQPLVCAVCFCAVEQQRFALCGIIHNTHSKVFVHPERPNTFCINHRFKRVYLCSVPLRIGSLGALDSMTSSPGRRVKKCFSFSFGFGFIFIYLPSLASSRALFLSASFHVLVYSPNAFGL